MIVQTLDVKKNKHLQYKFHAKKTLNKKTGQLIINKCLIIMTYE